VAASGIAIPAPNCVLCGGPPSGPSFPFESEWEGTVYRRLGCVRCGCTYVVPLPSADVFDRMYRPAAYHDRFHGGGSNGTDDHAQELARIERRVGRGARLLDFGCGGGDFLRAAVRLGFRAEGIEQNSQSIADAARRSGAPVGSLESVEAEGSRFDLIRLASVQGHLPNPEETFRRLERLLGADGRFLVCGPLEKQASLVYWFARSVKRVRRLAGLDHIVCAPPFHLSSVSWASQRFFLETVLGYRLSDIALEETGWPYLIGDDAHDQALGARVRRWVGAAAVRTSRTRLGRRIGLANSFRVIATPPPRVAEPAPVDAGTHRDHPG
jgi:SAM-dependent methyltransferase